MKNLIKKLLREGLLREEVTAGHLIVYHFTQSDPKEFNKGYGLGKSDKWKGSSRGPGLYGFVDPDILKNKEDIEWAKKEFGPNIIKFQVPNTKKIITFIPKYSKSLFGSELTPWEQLKKILGGKVNEFLKSNGTTDEELNKTGHHHPGLGYSPKLTQLRGFYDYIDGMILIDKEGEVCIISNTNIINPIAYSNDFKKWIPIKDVASHKVGRDNRQNKGPEDKVDSGLGPYALTTQYKTLDSNLIKWVAPYIRKNKDNYRLNNVLISRIISANNPISIFDEIYKHIHVDLSDKFFGVLESHKPDVYLPFIKHVFNNEKWVKLNAENTINTILSVLRDEIQLPYKDIIFNILNKHEVTPHKLDLLIAYVDSYFIYGNYDKATGKVILNQIIKTNKEAIIEVSSESLEILYEHSDYSDDIEVLMNKVDFYDLRKAFYDDEESFNTKINNEVIDMGYLLTQIIGIVKEKNEEGWGEGLETFLEENKEFIDKLRNGILKSDNIKINTTKELKTAIYLFDEYLNGGRGDWVFKLLNKLTISLNDAIVDVGTVKDEDGKEHYDLMLDIMAVVPSFKLAYKHLGKYMDKYLDKESLKWYSENL